MKFVLAILLIVFSMTATAQSDAEDAYKSQVDQQQQREQTEELRKQTKIMEQQNQDQRNAEANDRFQQNQNSASENLARYADYPDVLDAAVDLQDARMAYLNSQQTRMPGGSIAAGIEGIADAMRSKRLRKKVAKAEKALAKSIRSAEADMNKGN